MAVNQQEVIDAARDIIRLAKDYGGGETLNREMLLDPVLYAYFEGRFGAMSRQHQVEMHSKVRPQRIDFRHGSSNPSVMEFAVRPPSGGSTLQGSQNKSELRKLTRIVPSQAKTRILLLLDLYRESILKCKLKPTYDNINAGRGNFRRHSVRVIYVHPDIDYKFLWNPKK